jgi:hypothetical protein
MRGLFVLLLLPLVAQAEPPPNAALFEAGRTWTYDVTTTTYDIANWGSLTRPPKVTAHAVVTCTSSGDAITCDGPLEPPVAGRYASTADGLERDRALILAARPKATRKVAHDEAMHADRISGVRPGHGGWCVFEDSSDVDPDGASTEQCFGPTGIQSGDFDGGGGDWRRVSYRLRTTRSARAARTP